MNKSSIEHRSEIAAELSRAIDCHKAGDLAAAESIYTGILALDPGHPDASHLLGIIRRQNGDYRDAEKLIRQATRRDPSIAIYHVSLGDVFQAAGNLDNAIGSYENALELNPNLLEALCNMGNALRDGGDNHSAIGCYQRGLALNPESAELYNNLGLAYQFDNQDELAIEAFNKAILLKPDFFEACNNLANVYRDQHNIEEAITQYLDALALRPQDGAVNHNLGILFQMQQDFDRARVCYQKAITANPANAGAYNNLGKLFHDCNLLKEAISCYRKAIQIDPQHADAHFNLSLSLLAGGALAEGWPEYEWRFKRDKWKKIYPHRLKGPRWDGSLFKGKSLLVHSEQGFGDVIQFVRYLPRVKALGGDIIFEVRPELHELLQDFSGIDKLVTLSFDRPTPAAYDCHIPLMSLPGIFGTHCGNIPAAVPYLRANPEKIDLWKKRINGTAFKIGLVWAAKPTYNHNKSCPLELLLPLLESGRAEFIGLQKGPAARQIDSLPVDMDNPGEDFSSFADTAGAIECLDLVISVDTAVAHLAGAMGKPVWTLLPFSPDWRWLQDREDSPWYPGMKLFRQPQMGDWESVINKFVHSLKAHLPDN